ncbi:MAG TPA: RIO1 family regulatory kinase/ATPase [Anaeromyxobacter sp.]|nr:RIO1 family regulatory kinase/ATPase [Anaeromyxobacter sp.]
MNASLDMLVDEGVIDEIVVRLKSGKEADVSLVRHAGEIVVAKVYRARHVRSFKNDAAYREGRQVRSSRTQRAMDRGSRFGREAAEDAWKTKEADALHRLHAAGLRVPRPVLFYEGILLMELILDEHGRPAPRLVDAPLAPEQAGPLYAALRRQAIGMLTCDLIHGDLSPYNVLVAADGPVVIDFPQVVGAAHNSQAEAFFLRDLRNIHQFCAALDPSLRSAAGDGHEIWRAYVRRELTPDFVPTGRRVEPQPRRPGGGGGRPHAPAAGARPAQPAHARGGRPEGARGGQPGNAHRGSSGRQGPPQRGGSMPEVIRVERPPRGPSGPGGGAQRTGASSGERRGGATGQGSTAPAPGARRRRRRGRGGR